MIATVFFSDDDLMASRVRGAAVLKNNFPLERTHPPFLSLNPNPRKKIPMPTGTTQPIANGNLSLGDFLERAAKNFIPYNDGEPITRQPKDQNSAITRHLLELEQAQAELSAAIRRTDEEWKSLYEQEKARTEKRADERRAEKNILRGRYNAVKERVEAWPAPPLLLNLKRFLIEQLHVSLEGDCADTSSFFSIGTFENFRQKTIDDLQSLIKYLCDTIENERKRIAEWTTFYGVLWQEIDRFREFEAEEPSLVLPSKENAHVLP